MAVNQNGYVWIGKKCTFLGLPLSFTKYILDENKLITRKGFFNVEEDEVEIYRIYDKKLKLPFFQRLFGCGTIVLYVRGDHDTPEKVIQSVKNPRDVMNKIDKLINDHRDKYNIRGRDMTNPEYPNGEANHEI